MKTVSHPISAGTLYLHKTILMKVIKIDGAQPGLVGNAEKKKKFFTARIEI